VVVRQGQSQYTLEEVAMALHVRADRYRIDTGINHQEIFGASQLLSELIGFEVQRSTTIG